MVFIDSDQPITQQGALKKLVDILAEQRVIAVDTESNSLYAYKEQVCLIQFSTAEQDYLVDPLSLDDLSPLGRIFASTKIQKIFHAAEYDLICLKRDFNYKFNNLFDTMVAARILGRKVVGLGSMLEAEFNIQVDKRHQRANWGQRPLPDYLLDYARLDTHYLIGLRDMLAAQLEEKGLSPLAEEDFKRLCQVEANPENGKITCWRVNGVHKLSPQQAAVLLELCKYREDVAKQRNRPLFKVISDHTLHAIASNTPESIDELTELPGMTKHQVSRHGKALLQAVQRGLAAEPVHKPRHVRPTDEYLARAEALKQWRKLKAKELGVESDIIMPRDLLYDLANKNPLNAQELGECLQEIPYRYEQYGAEILGVLEKVEHRQ
jgi:ribonuclease D